jgi:circadian clock protein KaiC
MSNPNAVPRIPTGVRNLDAIFGGGLPQRSVTVVSGAPGSGKTILTQQLCFHSASADRRVLYFGTLSEPTAKTLLYLRQFAFFDPKKLQDAIHFVDLGVILRSEGLEPACAMITQHLKKTEPAIVVIDSFKVFDDLAESGEDLRKFGYEVAVTLMAWEATGLLLGEYGPPEHETNPLFSIVDGIVVLSQREALGEQQRYLRIVKMRGTDHSRDEHAFVITDAGLEMFVPRVAIQRGPAAGGAQARCKTAIPKLDEILGPGIPWGSSLLVSGVAGTGKTVLSLEFLYRGALAGEKGILFSFEETEDRLRAAARGLGWDFDGEIERGMIEIVFIPQPDIMVEAHLLLMRERIEAMGAKRVVIDSVSVFLHRVTDPQVSREKIFHLCSIVQNANAVGFFATDIPYGCSQISRFGVEETVVDGVLILSSTEEGLERQRYIEVYKLRNTAHLKGRHNMVIGAGGVAVYPRYGAEPTSAATSTAPRALDPSSRLSTGIPGLDELVGGGLLGRSATLVSGSAGIGKSTLGMQFLAEGARTGEPGLYVTLEEGPEQLLESADALGLPLRAAVDEGLVEILYVSREHLRAGQLLAVLADRLGALRASRLVLDAVTHMMTERVRPEELRHVLYQLVVRFKALDITSVLTLESPMLSSADHASDRGISPIADNVLVLRYRSVGEALVPMLTIVKSRGSSHDPRIHPVTIGPGGMRIGPAPGEAG